MQFKQYPSYKPSGVEWLGDVPEHWITLKNRHLFKFSKGLSITKENLQESGIPCVSYGEIHSKFGFDFNPEINDMKFVSPEYLETSKNCLLDSGDFIFADTSEDFEGSGNFSYLNSKSQVFAGYHTVIARLKFSHNPRFFAYVFDSNAHRKQIQMQVKGIKVFSITQGILKDIYSWLPPKADQEKIVAFLDTETTRIDNLIAKQEKLIELLEEQRKSIISHAVTKGLNPNAPMKDSGVEWLGEVPEHWMTPSSKHLLEIPITDGPHETPNFVDDGVPFISAEAISKGKIDFDKKRGYITPELNAIYSKKYSPKIEDIYMVKSGATTGKVAMVETTEEFNIWSPLAVFRCNKNKVLPKFLLAVFNSSHFYDALVLNWSYGTQQNIGMGVLSNIEIPCPPLKEQAEIIQHLDVQNTKFDKLIGTQSQLIEKLKEYRSSIISHAVTGKIDVREFGT
ncbi:restriction endonuclease subunit S (plasmid) [Acinetobacter pittii]|uniref:restriction endonuclease subunit S n=1 Tax=Acinetobacter pittii TaxID=48296 RepID=UPI0020307399|nr:restriction endonuclease subunit S [Acinetobacter pittii]MCM1963642.1 restriction endonuclease subunit S [Acinetobacter pittii]MCM1980212.1 restriction endonuclease subunit S [Acinetobacter pittii]